MSKITESTEDSNISLDEILLSIRSVVMDSDSTSHNDGVTPTATGDKRSGKTNNNTGAKSVSTSPKKSNDEHKSVPTALINETSANLPVKSYLLTQIIDMGIVPVAKPIVNDVTQHQVEQSIIDLVEILSASKDELPDSFYEKQDEIIKIWLNQYLPSIVESQVQKEIRRIGTSILQNN